MIYEIKKIDYMGLGRLLIVGVIINCCLFLMNINNNAIVREYYDRDYAVVIKKAVNNLNNGIDTRVMSDIISRYKGRNNTIINDSKYFFYTNNDFSCIFICFFVALVAFQSSNIEKKKKMRAINDSCPYRNKYYNEKILLIGLIDLVTVIVFLAEEQIICLLFEIDNMNVPLYQIPEYYETWFNGSIFEYRFLIVVGYALNSFWISYIISELWVKDNKIKYLLLLFGCGIIVRNCLKKVILSVSPLNICGYGECFKQYRIISISENLMFFPYYMGWIVLAGIYFLIVAWIFFVRKK